MTTTSEWIPPEKNTNIRVEPHAAATLYLSVFHYAKLSDRGLRGPHRIAASRGEDSVPNSPYLYLYLSPNLLFISLPTCISLSLYLSLYLVCPLYLSRDPTCIYMRRSRMG